MKPWTVRSCGSPELGAARRALLPPGEGVAQPAREAAVPMSPEQSRANHPSRTGSVAASQANLAELAKLEEQHIRVNERARIVREIRHFAQNLRERAGTSAERDLMEDVASMADAVADGIHDRRWTDWG